MSANEGGKKRFFSIPFACKLLQKSPNQVLAECAAFDARLLTDDELHHYRADKHYAQFDAMAQFICDFRLRDFQAFSIVTISFINNEATGCVISLGKPANLKLYSAELEVTKVFLVSLEELYHNGRIQEEDKTGTRVYTWKKDNRTVVSFISYPPSRSRKDTGARLSVQIRDTQLHPQGEYFELLYNRAQKSARDLVRRIDYEKKSSTQMDSTIPVGALDVSSELESFCNKSGQGKSAIIPGEIKGWNWGAFFFGWIWGISNRVWISILSAIPFVGIIMRIVLGAKGNEWSWQHKKWDSIEHFKNTQRKWGIASAAVFAVYILIFVVGLIVSSVPSTTPITQTPSMSGGTYHLTSWAKPRNSDMTAEELREAIAQGKISIVLNPVDPVNDSNYWNIDWEIERLSQTLYSINKQYYQTHAYIEGEFDCNDMAVGLWNALLEKDITSVIVVGNLDLDNESFAECDHTWLLITYIGFRVYAIETTNGEVYSVAYDIDGSGEQLKQYLEGYYFALPSDLRAAVKERW